MNKIIFIVMVLLLVIIGANSFKKTEKEIIEEEKRAIFISYIENSKYLQGKTIKEKKNNIDKIINDLDQNNFNMIILHVRAFSDAIYNSSIFPYARTISSKEGTFDGFDVLKYYIDVAHQKGIEIHAWINPYRISNSNDVTNISQSNPAYKWLNTNNIEIKDGIYYNPASNEVLKLIISGIEEIIKNYNIDGIHYDDYFYPNQTIDMINYKEYQNNGGKLNIKEYRFQNINRLLEETSKTIKKYKPTIKFGISPAGNIENVINYEYLDIKYILEKTTYLDYVMPQIYFGFLNSNKPFIKTANEWNNLIKNNKTKLYIALAPYKIGKIDNYAGEGKEEWLHSTNILARQIIYSRTLTNYKGFSLFRYDYIFNKEKDNKNLKQEIFNMLELLD